MPEKKPSDKKPVEQTVTQRITAALKAEGLKADEVRRVRSVSGDMYVVKIADPDAKKG